MEKLTWQKIIIDRNSREPSPRWGHSSVLVKDEMLFFGGYADSNYMSDLWTFNINTMAWTEQRTMGTAPSVRSNCTIHYNEKSNSVIVFGGGGPNKKRFCSVSVLNWDTKRWTQIDPPQNQKAPWERTYHSSQILYPYLIVFGGEGLTDLDDLWVFNLETHKWSQIEVDALKPRPTARRFHTSVLLDNSFYVIAGCYGKYRCLGDIWKIDLTPLIQTGKTTGLEWKEIKIKGSSFLTRWGHTSAVFDNKIYVFGGRFSNDLQDILIIDPARDSLKTLKVSGQIPKARRRHSAIFVGSCMIVFGGFNGEYFNDLSYINVFDSKQKSNGAEGQTGSELISWVNKQFLSDSEIISQSGKSIKVHKGLIVPRFQSEEELDRFLVYCQNKFSEETTKQIVEILYLGAGKLPQEISSSFQIQLFDTVLDKNNHIRKIIDPDFVQLGSLVSRKKQGEVICLSREKYSSYLQRYHQSQYYDLLLVFGQQDCIPVNKTLLAAASPYFAYLLKNHKEQNLEIEICQQFKDARVFLVLLNYLQSGYLVIPEGLDETCWMLLYHISEYLCLSNLMALCESQMIGLLTIYNCQKMLQYSSEQNMASLALHSGQLLFKKMLDGGRQKELVLLKEKKDRSMSEQVLCYLLDSVEFDLKQQEKREERLGVSIIKRRSQNNIEKENDVEWTQE